MGRAPCCDKQGLKKGPWTPDEDKILVDFIQANGHGSWRSLPKLAGLLRCGKSCRLRWTNYLRPDIKRGPFTPDEQKSIIQLHGIVGNKWSTIAAHLPGRTDNEIKNYWNTHLKKRLLRMGIDPETYAPSSSPSSASTAAAADDSAASSSFTATRHMAQWESARLEAEARLSRESLLFSSSSSTPNITNSATAASLNNNNQSSDLATATKAEPSDFFLRIWNSDVGESFRKAAASVDSSPDSCCYSKHSSAEAGGAAAGADSSSSNEVEEETSEESYQLYLDFGGDDLGLFQSQLGSCFSLFSADLNDASLDTAFK